MLETHRNRPGQCEPFAFEQCTQMQSTDALALSLDKGMYLGDPPHSSNALVPALDHLHGETVCKLAKQFKLP